MSIFHIANPVGPYGEVTLIHKLQGRADGEATIHFCRVYNANAKDVLEARVYFQVEDLSKVTPENYDQLRHDVRILIQLALAGRDAPNPKHGFCVNDVRLYYYDQSEAEG